MSAPAIRILDGAGAEITGVDLATMDAATFAIVKATFNQHGLVFFRNQSLTELDQIALAQRFGRINVNRFFAAHPEYPQIANMYTAYEALSPGLQQTLEGLNAVHSAKHIFGVATEHVKSGEYGGRVGNADAAVAKISVQRCYAEGTGTPFSLGAGFSRLLG